MTDKISWTDKFSKAGAAREAQQVSYEEAKEMLDSGMKKNIGQAVEEVFLAEITKAQKSEKTDVSDLATEIMDVQVKLYAIEKIGSGNVLTYDAETKEIKPINSTAPEEEKPSSLSEFEQIALTKGKDIKIGRLAKQLQADLEEMPEGKTFRINVEGRVQSDSVEPKDLNVSVLVKNLEKLAESYPEKSDDLLPERLKEMYPEHLGRNEVHGR